MNDLGKFAKNFGGSMVWIFAALIVGMVILNWVAKANWGAASIVAGDTQKLATTGMI